jgi:hypothetical protein
VQHFKLKKTATVRILKIVFENFKVVDRTCAFNNNSVQFSSVPVQYIDSERPSDQLDKSTPTKQ